MACPLAAIGPGVAVAFGVFAAGAAVMSVAGWGIGTLLFALRRTRAA
jgi:hypothetical protein